MLTSLFKRNCRSLLHFSVVKKNVLVKPIPIFSTRMYTTEQKKKAAVVFCGCGYLDGSEVTESVSLLISLTRKGYEVKCFAPALEIDECVTYTTKKSDPREERYMDVESARISRSQIENLKKLNEQDFDCLVIPGGEGALSNFSNYAFYPDEFEVVPELESAIKKFHAAKKPIAALGYSAAVVAKVLGTGNDGPGVAVTVGDATEEMGDQVEQLGNKHVAVSTSEEVTIDKENKIISGAGYNIAGVEAHSVYAGAENLVESLEKVY